MSFKSFEDMLRKALDSGVTEIPMRISYDPAGLEPDDPTPSVVTVEMTIAGEDKRYIVGVNSFLSPHVASGDYDDDPL